MVNKTSILKIAIRTLELESESISGLTAFIDESFAEIVTLIYESAGRLVITGIGKSAIIAQKIVATLNSTGTPALFMHAAEAIHGDLGLIQRNDVVLCISKSGNSPEIKALAPLVKTMGNKLIGMTGNLESDLAKQSDYLLNTTVSMEACPHNLAPTSSTAAQMAMGDALAMCLMETRGFTDRDFARYHPGGALGKRLYVTMGDLIGEQAAPAVSISATVDEAIIEMTAKRLGATAVIENGSLKGIVTDGDLRRMLGNGQSSNEVALTDIMSTNPRTISDDALAVKGFEMMEKHSISQLIVLDSDQKYLGIVHLHDILKEGIF